MKSGNLCGQPERMPWIDQCVKTVLDGLYPPICALCRTPTPAGLCADCVRLVPRVGGQCPACGGPGHELTLCGACQRSPRAFQLSIIPFHYAPPLTGLIYRYKYGKQIGLANPLGRVLSAAVESGQGPRPDVITGVPLHWTRTLSRGFNQSLELARTLSVELKIPCDYSLVTKRRRTPPQAGLPLSTRKHNLRNCFSATRNVNGLSIAVVDDVVTTTETVNAVALALNAAGAVHVQVWALARA